MPMLVEVNAARLGRLARTIRIRLGLTQAMVAARAGVSRQAVSILERGGALDLRLRTVDRIATALGARLNASVLWNGPELDRMLDAGHAALGASVKRRLERWGWHVRVEVSFSRYGERGRIDLLGWHPGTRILLVIEIKTQLIDVQALLGSLDVKARLARHVGEQFGWEASVVVPAIVFAASRTTRRRLSELDTLFDRYPVRGRAAISWMRRPTRPISGALWLAALPAAAGARPDIQRVRPRRVSRTA